ARGRLERAAHLLDREARLRRQLGVGRQAPEALGERALDAAEALAPLGHPEGHAHRLRVPRDLARDGLTDPPRGVGREARADAMVELVDGAHEAEVALLDEVRERHARAAI